jgi:hypothetical protein
VNARVENLECIEWLDNAAIIVTTQMVDINEEQETEIEEVKDLYAELLRKEELTVLSKAIATITKYSAEDGYDVGAEVVITELCRLQQRLRWHEQ